MEQVKAVVRKLVKGRYGPYAVAVVDGLEGSITFSLSADVWQDGKAPEPGSIVILSDLYRKQAGWRARRGRLYRPSDEQAAARRSPRQGRRRGS